VPAELRTLSLRCSVNLGRRDLLHIWSLTSLKRLVLADVDLPRDADLTPVRNLANLEELDVTGLDDVTEEVLTAIGSLLKLRRLALSELHSPRLLELRGLAALEVLDLWACWTNSADLAAAVSELPALRRLVLCQCQYGERRELDLERVTAARRGLQVELSNQRRQTT
jgi:hypothetical protein